MLELLREADMILDACGRPVPPPGYRFVDLPRCMSFAASQNGGGEGPADIEFPYANKLENTSKTLFLCRGISTNTGLRFQVKWPNGRFWNQTPGAARQFIQGAGTRMFAMKNEQPIEAGGRIAVTVADGLTAGVLNVDFWGVLRYLLKDTAESRGAAQTLNQNCIVGYPSAVRPGGPQSPHLAATMPDPIAELDARPRYWCGPNGNIMAPEFMLGNQNPFTPVGFDDEPFTFFSDSIECGTAAADQQQLNNRVLIPGSDQVIVRGVRPIVSWSSDEVGGWPVFAVRTPSGVSVMGGDLIPQISAFQWLPFFPNIATNAGERLIVDVALIDVSGEGSITTKFEFSAVKRRRVS